MLDFFWGVLSCMVRSWTALANQKDRLKALQKELGRV